MISRPGKSTISFLLVDEENTTIEAGEARRPSRKRKSPFFKRHRCSSVGEEETLICSHAGYENILLLSPFAAIHGGMRDSMRSIQKRSDVLLNPVLALWKILVALDFTEHR